MTQENTPVKVGLLELLYRSLGSQFVIPAYQRNYTWIANKEVRQLFEDIKAVLYGERTKHFLGIMIYLGREIDPFHTEKLVIDGQQRLTTIFLSLYAIKELMLENKMINEAELLESRYLINPNCEFNRLRLKPLVSDDDVYQQIVKRDYKNIQARHSNVFQNFIWIKSYIKSLLKEHGINDILNAMNKLFIVCVPIGQDDYPQKIFESINATGAKLTASDLIRNFLLMPIDSNKQDEYYEKYWKKIERLINGDSKQLESFFRFFLMAKLQSLVNKRSVYRIFTDWCIKYVDEYGIEGIFVEIVNFAEYYYDIYKAPIETLDVNLRKPIEEFRFVLSDMPAPMLMKFYSLYSTINEYGNSHITSKQLGEIITILNSYLMRRSLCGLDTSDITYYFPSLLKETLSECDGNYTNIVEIYKKNLVNRNKGLAKEMPDDRKLTNMILNANMYSLRSSVSVFFMKLEMENNPAPIDFRSLNIEHLMPQTPTVDWYSALNTDRETYEYNIHRLGNLTFASKTDNSKMGNKVWEYKNKVLKTTNHLKINQDIILKEHWTLDDIDIRTRQLIQDIIRLYPYYDVSETSIEKIPIYLSQKNVFAQAYFFPENGCVEIQKGSWIVGDFDDSDSKFDAIRNYLIDNEIITESGEHWVFSDNYTVFSKHSDSTALSKAAGIILNSSRNGFDCWITEKGIPIGEVEGIRKPRNEFQ